MLPPHELRAKDFTHTIRGYSISEVDEQMEFMIEKYTELYRENDRLENELKEVRTHLAELEQNSDAIRRAMVNAQREEHKIITEAQERSDLIMRTAKSNCDRILMDFRVKIREERLTLHRLREAISEFRENSLKQYQISMQYIEQLAPRRDSEPEWEMTEEEYAAQLLEQMKLDISDSVTSSYTEEMPTEEDNIRKGIPDGSEEKPAAKQSPSGKTPRKPARSLKAKPTEAELDMTFDEILAAADGATSEVRFEKDETKTFDRVEGKPTKK